MSLGKQQSRTSAPAEAPAPELEGPERGGAGNAARQDSIAAASPPPGGDAPGIGTPGPVTGTTGSPADVLLTKRGTPEWGRTLARSPDTVQWLIQSSPAATAVDELAGPGIAAADLPAIVANVADWPGLIGRLPRGSAMATTTRAALKRVKDHLGAASARAAFERRFGHALTERLEITATPGQEATEEDARAGRASPVAWLAEDIRVVWNQMDVLPDGDVTSSTIFVALQAIRSGNFASGFWTAPNIQISQGAGSNPYGLQHTVRHEIGHAVEDGPLHDSVSAWLKKDVGFWYMSNREPGIAELVNDLGGWPRAWTDASGASKSFGESEQQRVIALLLAHSGSTRALSATGPALPNASAPTTDDERMYAALNPRIQSCFALSASHWFNAHSAMPRGARGRVFYNHYYERPYYFSDLAENTINATADSYTAMSESEFFANCYAEYFKDPAGCNDHAKWGGNLPAPVRQFFARVVLEHQPYAEGSYGAAAPGGAGQRTGASGAGGG